MKIKRCLLIVAAAIMLLAPSCKTVSNHSPIIISLEAEPEVVSPSGICQIGCIASDPDGDELSYEWSASKGKIDGSGAMVTWTAPESERVYNIAITVTDGYGSEVTDYVTVTVKVNSPPVIDSLSANSDWVAPLGSLQVKCEAEDPDGDELSYEWLTNGGDISGTGSEVTWTSPEATGMYDIAVMVTDAYGAGNTRSVTISVAPYSPPVIEDMIVTAEHKYFKKGAGGYLIGKETSCRIECLASVPKGGELSYGWSAAGGKISGEGSVVIWTAPNVAGRFTVTVIVSDITGNMVSKSIVCTVVACSPCTFG